MLLHGSKNMTHIFTLKHAYFTFEYIVCLMRVGVPHFVDCVCVSEEKQKNTFLLHTTTNTKILTQTQLTECGLPTLIGQTIAFFPMPHKRIYMRICTFSKLFHLCPSFQIQRFHVDLISFKK